MAFKFGRKRKSAFGRIVRGKKAKRSRFVGPKKGTRQLAKVRLGSGFPTRVTMSHKYREQITLSPTAGAMASYNFSANSMYDPNLTGTGHQPMYFDQMAALYDHFVVNSATIKVTFVPKTQQNFAISCAVFENDDGSLAPTSVDFVGEQTSGSVVIIPPNSSDAVIMRRTYKPRKIWGADPMALAAQQGSAAASPTESTVWSIVSQNHTSGATADVFVWVDIVYNATWTEVKDQGGS